MWDLPGQGWNPCILHRFLNFGLPRKPLRVSKERQQPGQEGEALCWEQSGLFFGWKERTPAAQRESSSLVGGKGQTKTSEKPVSEEEDFRHGNSRVRSAATLPRSFCLVGWMVDLELWVEERAGKGAMWVRGV